MDDSYYVALNGVTRYGLAKAVEAILQGGLGHQFYPNPVELRIQCDKAMEWHDRERERIRRRERMESERIPDRAEPTPDEKRRVQETYRRFLASYDNGARSADEADRAAIRARYGMTDEVLATMKDHPVPANFKRLA